MEKVRYMISDAAALAGVETHVLRYWEEELDLTIPRNEMGHRYYTRENIQEFQKIKELKEKGYQLKAIRMILHNKNPEDAGVSVPDSAAPGPLPACNREHHHTVVAKPDRQNTDKTDLPVNTLSAEERMAQFRELMSDIVGHAIAQNNEALTLDISKEIRETVLKEMNYLIREQNDMTEERYRQLSAEIRGKLQKKHTLFAKKEKGRSLGFASATADYTPYSRYGNLFAVFQNINMPAESCALHRLILSLLFTYRFLREPDLYILLYQLYTFFPSDPVTV